MEGASDRNLNIRRDLLPKVMIELKIHTHLEEEIFYAAFGDASRAKADRKLYHEVYEEHHVVDLLLAELMETDADDETFPAKVRILKDIVERHVDKEEKQMFPRARDLFGTDGLRELAEQIEERRLELEEEMEEDWTRRHRAA
jgi:hemerythrin superfamily protein